MAWAIDKPFVGVNHILAHLYASRLAAPEDIEGSRPQGVAETEYPFIGLLVSGGHSIICRVEDFDRIEIIGTTIDDAIGEAFDKVAKHFGFGYPGGAAIDKLAQGGDETAFAFPKPSLHKGEHRYDLSYSGLKTAAVRQLDLFKRPGAEATPANIAASFQKAAVDLLLSRLFRAVEDTGLKRVVAGGGVAANSYLRRTLAARSDLEVHFPPLRLCGDNGAMVAGIGCKYLERGESSGLDLGVSARVPLFRRLSK
jgi:N6-L-threonylcarbamoyladenine synthase